MRKLIVAGLLILAIVSYILMVRPDHGTGETIVVTNNPTAVKVQTAIDCTGKWQSETSKLGTKMIAEVKNNTIFVQMYSNNSYTGLWYGTFDILQPGKVETVSKAIQDPEHLVFSTAETKSFLYQGGSLIFDYSIMGVRTTVEMKRAA